MTSQNTYVLCKILKIGSIVQNGCQNGFQIIETSQHTSMSQSLDLKAAPARILRDIQRTLYTGFYP